jgi:hypothetical protein
MKLKQLSVFLENKPGALSEPCRLLAKAGINIQTFSLADTQEFGILRLIVEDSDKARRLLQRNGFAVKVTKVVVLEVLDRPGGLAAVLDALDGSGISVKYAYAYAVKRASNCALVFCFDDPETAMKILQKKGFDVEGSEDLVKQVNG